MSGGTGSDSLDGGRGNDQLLGGSPPPEGGGPLRQERPGASDNASGGSGADVVDGTPGVDELEGGRGDDFVSDGENRRGAIDTLDGGSGGDFLFPRNAPAGRDVV